MDAAELEKRFAHHEVSYSATRRIDDIRKTALTLARLINSSQPDAREKSEALTHLEDVTYWANAGIARNAPGDVDEG